MLADLRAAAALASGLPMLVVPTDAPEATLAACEAVLGPLPQAELAGDCEVWAVLPGLDTETWLAVRAELPDGAHLVPADAPGRRAAVDLGLLAEEVTTHGAFQLVHRVDVERGLSVFPQGMPGLPDPAVLALEAELVDALGRGFSSDRGAGTVQPVVCPHTGRFGVVLSWTDPPALAPLAEALAPCIAARAEHPVLRLAPTAEVDLRMGLSVLLWAVAPARDVLPSDLAPRPGLEPSVDALRRLVPELAEAIRTLEIQVLPAVSHTDTALAVAEILEAGELPAAAAAPRWLASPDGPRFAPCWTVETPELDGLAVLEAVADHPLVAAVRVLPAEPAGADLVFGVLDLGGVATDVGWATALRHGVSGRDLLPQVDARDPDSIDDAVERHLYAALAEAPGASWIPGDRLARPVVDGAGVRGSELRLDPTEAVDAGALDASLRALLAARPAGYLPHVTWGRRGGDLVVQLWRRPAIEDDGDEAEV